MRFGRRPYHRLPHSGRTAAGRRRRSSQNVSPALGRPSGILPDGQVYAPCSGASCEGRDYRTLVRQFRDAGFENLSLIAEDTGFDGAAVFDGCVLFVSIDGDKAFSSETVFAPDAAVETITPSNLRTKAPLQTARPPKAARRRMPPKWSGFRNPAQNTTRARTAAI